jgi:arylsulfatase A-like enzyme
MTRRQIFALPAALAAAATAASRKPNIVLLLTDDQRKDTIAALGGLPVRTPHQDALVRSGVSFNNAYCMGGHVPAVCLPSRMMIQRGVSWFKATKQAAPDPCIAKTMTAAGYVTYHFGKRGNEDVKAHQFYQHNHYVQPDDHVERRAGKPSRQMADHVTAFLKEHKGDKPFFLYLADAAPHDPRVAPPEYLAMYDPNRIALPPNYMPMHPFDNGELLIRDEKLAAWPRTDTEIRKHLQEYYAVVTYMDEQIGRIVQAVRDRGEFDNTIFVLTSDQGLAVGSHGLMGKQNLYQHSMSPMLVFSGPGIPKGKRTDAFAYLFDIYPTLCELAGIPVPAEVEGKSLAGVLNGRSKGVRDTIFLGYKNLQRAVRRGNWKLIRYPQVDRTQLFDLSKDPHETRDLAADPKHAGKVRELLALMAQQQQLFGDTAPLTVDQPRDGKVDEAFFRQASQ